MKIGQNLLDKIAYFPLVIGLTVSGVTLVISALLSHQNNRQLQQIILTETAAVKNEIIGQLERRILALERMAKRWEVQGGTPQTRMASRCPSLSQSSRRISVHRMGRLRLPDALGYSPKSQ